MNYKIIYDQIIERAKPRGLNKKSIEGYFEKHHIIPKCLGGTNDKSNLVLLTSREHFICHHLLWKTDIHNKSLLLAFTNMRCANSKYKREFRLSSRQYEIVRIAFSKAQKELKTGSGNPCFGKVYTLEEREKISKRNKGRIFTEEWKKKISDVKKGKKTGQIVWNKGLKTGHNPNNNSPRMLGKKHSEETKQKMSESQLKRSNCEKTDDYNWDEAFKSLGL